MTASPFWYVMRLTRYDVVVRTRSAADHPRGGSAVGSIAVRAAHQPGECWCSSRVPSSTIFTSSPSPTTRLSQMSPTTRCDQVAEPWWRNSWRRRACSALNCIDSSSGSATMSRCARSPSSAFFHARRTGRSGRATSRALRTGGRPKYFSRRSTTSAETAGCRTVRRGRDPRRAPPAADRFALAYPSTSSKGPTATATR